MMNALCLELENRKEEFDKLPMCTIYFGGGTPSLVDQEEMTKIFETIQKNYDVSGLLEVTLEANPDDITTENLRFWRQLGISRLSIGIQSFREEDLRWMNRAHNAKEASTCIDLAQRNGFDSFSVDLIYGLPNLSLADWQTNIQNVIDYGVDHISAYCLTVEEKTLLAKQVKEGELQLSNEEEQAEQFQFLVEYLSQAGYEQYEVSNFCLPGREAIHNTSYWKGVPYIGIGPSAHSFNGESRRFNISNNALYMRHIEEKEIYFEVEKLTNKERFNEQVLTGLRTKWGVDLTSLSQVHALDDEFIQKKNQFITKNWMIENEGHIKLFGDGWLLADFIASELFV